MSKTDEAGRLAYLRSLKLLDAPPEAAFDRLTRLAAQLLAAPIALVSLVDRDRQFFLSRVDPVAELPGPRETHITRSFCKHVVERNDALVIDNTLENALVRENPAVSELSVAAYVGVPLQMASGHVLGSLCCIDRRPRHWTEDHVSILRDLAASVVTEIEYRAKARSLALLEGRAAQLGPPLNHLGDLLAAVQAKLRPGHDGDLFSLTVQASTLTRHVAAIARDVTEWADALPAEGEVASAAVDLRKSLARAVAAASEIYGPGRILLDESPVPLLLECSGHAVQEGLVRLVSGMAALSSESGPAHVAMSRLPEGAHVDVSVPTHIPAPALLRILTSLTSPTCSTAEGEGGLRLEMNGGDLCVTGPDVVATASESQGTTVHLLFPIIDAVRAHAPMDARWVPDS